MPFTLQYEGGYANVTGDKGGETYRGITRKNWSSWGGWKIVDQIKPTHNQIIPSLENLVKEFYFNNYFKNKGFDRINNLKVATVLFDFAVHGGYSTKGLQTILKNQFDPSIIIDGAMGAKTIDLINKVNSDQLANLIMQWREKHLKQIISNDPSQQKFYTGWMNRLKSLSSVLNIIKNNTFLILILVGVSILAIYLTVKRRVTDEKLE